MPDLDQFLTENQPIVESTPEPDPEPEPTPAAEAAPEAVTGEPSAPPARELPPRGEDGKWIARETAAPKEDHRVPLEAMLAERERRQAAERELQELRAKEKQQPPPDFWENPQAAVEATIKSREEELIAKAEARARETFFKFTENSARSRYSDYEQQRAVFAEEAQRNPMLAAQLRDAPDPAEFIYQQGRMASELREVGGDLSAYRKRLEADIRQRVERELAEKSARVAAIPQSLNTEPSKGAGIAGGSWAGPTPLEDILPNRRE